MAPAGAALLGAQRLPARGTIVAPPAFAASSFRGARPSYAIETVGGVRRVVTFPTAIQNVVVIVMENRTVDNLFSAYYNQRFPGGGTWGSALNLYNPSDAKQPLTENGLAAPFDPRHSHDSAFINEFSGKWDKEHFSCEHYKCPPGTTAYSYVPAAQTLAYEQLVANWAFANDVLQANEGPSWPAHQYLIAAQSGGVTGSLTAPYSEAENPGHSQDSDLEESEESGDNTLRPDILRDHSRFCDNKNGVRLGTLDMLDGFAQHEKANPFIPACNEYGSNKRGTILDEAAAFFGSPTNAAWQYIANSERTIWAAPLGVQHLYNAYVDTKNKNDAPFTVDPGAQTFVKNLASANPTRPFAHLTYITPCFTQSDHPIAAPGPAEGPEWLAWIVNAIGESRYWKHTAIVVVWDDWGGFFDHVKPYHPFPNAYPVPHSPNGNPSDPYEYGFRVPMIVISPYVTRPAYVSTPQRSQSAILHYIEDAFTLPSLNVDDAYNDDLNDMFDFSHPPLPYVPVTGVAKPTAFC
jgi:phospholipase C